jgi:segregation and condensation protein B
VNEGTDDVQDSSPTDAAADDDTSGAAGAGPDAAEWSDAVSNDDPNATARDWEARRAIEAVVLATVEPVEARLLAQLVELSVAKVEELCAQLAADYEEQGHGFVLAKVAGGYRFQTHPDVSAYVERFVLEGQHARLSAPALETLAIVAYKQPISRGQMSAIRGVNVEATLNTLLQRGYVQEVGRDPGPGAAVLYGTTRTFLERLGLDSVDDLAPLGDFVPDPSVVEALERGLHISDDPRAVTETPAEAATGDESSDESLESVDDDTANAADADTEADALLRDDAPGPLD